MKRIGWVFACTGCLFLPVITLILILRAVTSYEPRYRRIAPSGSSMAISPSGHVRILARKIVESASLVEWQWTIIGDRNWSGAQSGPDGFRLTNSYPFNSRTATGGTHVWVLDAALRYNKGAAHPQIRIERSLRGSNSAGTANFAVLPFNAPSLASALHILHAKDELLSLPVSIHLADAAGQALNLKVDP